MRSAKNTVSLLLLHTGVAGGIARDCKVGCSSNAKSSRSKLQVYRVRLPKIIGDGAERSETISSSTDTGIYLSSSFVV